MTTPTVLLDDVRAVYGAGTRQVTALAGVTVGYSGWGC